MPASTEVDSKTGLLSSTKVKPELQNNFRHARRIYIGNVSESITQEFLSEWLYRSMEICGGLLDQGNPILKT